MAQELGSHKWEVEVLLRTGTKAEDFKLSYPDCVSCTHAHIFSCLCLSLVHKMSPATVNRIKVTVPYCHCVLHQKLSVVVVVNCPASRQAACVYNSQMNNTCLLSPIPIPIQYSSLNQQYQYNPNTNTIPINFNNSVFSSSWLYDCCLTKYIV